MHIQMTPFLRKNSISLQEIWVLKPFNQKRKIGTLICWDQWYPEAAQLDGTKAEVLFTNSDRMASGRKRRIWRKSTWRLDECYEGRSCNGVCRRRQ
jgi:hypothetical protein